MKYWSLRYSLGNENMEAADAIAAAFGPILPSTASNTPTSSSSNPQGRNHPRRRPPLNYHIDVTSFPQYLQQSFAPSSMDHETSSFLDSVKKPSTVAASISGFLELFCSRTTANSVTNRGKMFVLSTENARRLLDPFLLADTTTIITSSTGNSATPAAAGAGEEPRQSSPPSAPSSSLSATHPSSTRALISDISRPRFKLLDIGAGDGGVTSKLQPLFTGGIYCTEASAGMRWRLWQKGFNVIDELNDVKKPSKQGGGGGLVDCVAALNVLDRCDKPIGLLTGMKSVVKPGGLLLLAVVLPWCPFVEDGNKQKRPSEQLPMAGARCADRPTFEHCVLTLIQKVFEPQGLEVKRWTRVPYLCEGDQGNEYYALDDAVFVLQKKATTEATTEASSFS